LKKKTGNPEHWENANDREFCPQSNEDCPKVEIVKERCHKLDQILEGEWKDDFYHPKSCYIKMFTPVEADRCITNRTIALVGDSTMGGLWRNAKQVFGNHREYAAIENLTIYLQNRQPGDMRLPKTVARYSDSKHYLIRSYALWQAEMWDKLGYASSPDNQNHTIKSILLNQTHDLVLINIAAHHQNVKVGGLDALIHIYSALPRFYALQGNVPDQSKRPVPMLWIHMNAQYAPKKGDTAKHQDLRLSRAINFLAEFEFNLNPDIQIPILDVHSMMASNLAELSSDGMHSSERADLIKWHMLLNFLCPNHDGSGFDPTFKSSL